jgi:predicted Zn-dependent protease
MAALLLLTLAACALNPATGKRQLILVSEGKELQLGKENDKAVLAQFGRYEDQDLQEYIREIGKKLAARSERPDLEWSFKVVDDPLVNAFALPGGYIYVTRGILAHFDSEAEMASVLGHEIGHVTARHSVNQMSKAQLASIVLGAGMLVREDLQALGGVAEAGLGVLFLKFGRDDERQADDLGLRYLIKSGYDPRPMAAVFTTLKRVSKAGGGDRPPGWMSTHPDPENREQRTNQAIRERERDFSNSLVRREEYLRKIDGIVFGDDPRHGFLRGQQFFHPEMRFRIDFPDGWKVVNQRQAVVSKSADDKALLQLTLAEKSTSEEALRSFLAVDGVTRSRTWTDDISGLSARRASFTVALQGGTVEGEVAFVAYDGRVFQILGFGNQASWGAHRPSVRAAMASFRQLTESDALNVEPRRLRIVRPETTQNLEEFSRSYQVTISNRQLAILNGLRRDEPFRAGRAYKVVQGGTLPETADGS